MTVINQPGVKSVVGDVKLCVKEAQFDAKKFAEVSGKGAKEPKKPKEKKEQPKKEKKEKKVVEKAPEPAKETDLNSQLIFPLQTFSNIFLQGGLPIRACTWTSIRACTWTSIRACTFS